MICGIILCGGSSTRMGVIDKLFVEFKNKPLLHYTLSAFNTLCDSIVIAARDKQRCEEIAQHALDIPYVVVDGGETRQESVHNALKHVPSSCCIVAVHDGARCLINPETIQKCIESAKKFGSGVAGVYTTDTLRKIEDNILLQTVDRNTTIAIQTPQVFEYKLLVQAYEEASKLGIIATDDSMLVSRLCQVHFVEAEYSNIKVTTVDDLTYVKLKLGSDEMRVGYGFDSHVLVKDRKLILAGVEFESEFGLYGHSDADVLTHAIIDAILGAAGLPDIGELFPDTHPKFQGISSLELLKSAHKMVVDKGYCIYNIDSTIIINRPKISPRKQEMIQSIAQVLNLNEDQVNIKGKTAEGLDGNTVQAMAVVTLNQ